MKVRRLESARSDWALIWTHGLTSSVESEDEGRMTCLLEKSQDKFQLVKLEKFKTRWLAL